MRLIFVRHGASKENLEHRFLGITDSPLHILGAEQALSLAQNIPKVDHLYSSPLVRCLQTASLVWPKIDKTIIDDLRETDFGPFEGKTHEELKDNEMYNRWLAFPDDPSVVPLVEDVVSCGLRASKALGTLINDARSNSYETVGIVSHGGTIMSILARHGMPVNDYYNWRMDNCGGYIVELSENEDSLDLSVLDKF